MALAFAGVFILSLTVSAATHEFRADDEQQKIILTTSMPTYNGSDGYAIYGIGYLVNITNGSASKTKFLNTRSDRGGV